MRRILVGLLAGAAIGVGAMAIVAGGDTGKSGAVAAAEDPGLAVLRSNLEPGVIVLIARNNGDEPVRIAQVLVNDAFVDFHAARPEVAPRGQTQVMVHYPWVAGESYEIGLLTGSGAIVEYELEGAGEVT